MPAQLAQLSAGQRVRTWRAVLDPTDVQGGCFKVDLLPPKVHDFGRPKAVPIGHEYHQGIAVAVAVGAGGLDQLFPLRRRSGAPWSAVRRFWVGAGQLFDLSYWRD
jgi:hypothetical protein